VSITSINTMESLDSFVGLVQALNYLTKAFDSIIFNIN